MKSTATRQREFKQRLKNKGFTPCEIWLSLETKARLDELVECLDGPKHENYSLVIDIALDAFCDGDGNEMERTHGSIAL